MEGATHFIEVYGMAIGGVRNSAVFNIESIEEHLDFSYKSDWLETVAVWYIKPTDVPIEHRLGERIQMGSVCDTETYAILCSKRDESHLFSTEIMKDY